LKPPPDFAGNRPSYSDLHGDGGDGRPMRTDAISKHCASERPFLTAYAVWKRCVFDRGAAERENIRQASEDFRSRTMEVLRMAFLSSGVLEFFTSLSIALVAVYFGFLTWANSILVITAQA
jgi:hypothetical protein